jgi:multimeric flavodoxin WrbA
VILLKKKILLVDASPRKQGNSAAVVKLLASDLKDTEITVFAMRDQQCQPCTACAACQGKETQHCVLHDDITPLLPLINTCDAIVMVTPIYNYQITSQAKLFIERWYPFFNVEKKNMSNTSKFGKKAALVCVFWGSPRDTIARYADWTVQNFSQIGAEQFQTLVMDGIPGPGDVLKRPEYVEKIHELGNWLAE